MAEGSSIAKYGKIASLVAALGAGGAAGYGYKGDDGHVRTSEMTVQARSGKVWDLLSEPENTPRWCPKEVMDIERVQTLGPKGVGKVAAFFGAGDAEPLPGEPTHIFHLRDGRQLKLCVTTDESDKVRRETVVLKEGKLSDYVASAEWGIEVERSDESIRETKMTVRRKLKFTRPLGVLHELYMRLSGKREEEDLRVFENIERAARDL